MILAAAPRRQSKCDLCVPANLRSLLNRRVLLSDLCLGALQRQNPRHKTVRKMGILIILAGRREGEEVMGVEMVVGDEEVENCLVDHVLSPEV